MATYEETKGIFQRPQSPYWQCEFRTKDGKLIRESTKTRNLDEAVKYLAERREIYPKHVRRPPKLKNAKQPAIYLVGAAGTTMFKVGFSAGDVESRLTMLQVGSPAILFICGSFTVEGRADERRLHELLAPYHTHGEWFDLGPEMVAKVLNESWRCLNGIRGSGPKSAPFRELCPSSSSVVHPDEAPTGSPPSTPVSGSGTSATSSAGAGASSPSGG